ncbi:MAG: hypothetical protein HUU50_10715 [Candidatus Brocadiae bacterium]|nr:hypothetical protein [Candidatus Brocadiia bacterium]
MSFRILLLLLFVSFFSCYAQEETRPDFNAYVVSILEKYPTDGTHPYYWPSSGTWAGITRDLHYRGALFAKGDDFKRCFCCGITFEVFFLAYEKHCQDQGKEFIIQNFDAKALNTFLKQWFGSDGNRKTLLNAIVSNGLGFSVPMDKAKKGDFVQLWRYSGSGHSVIFISWVYDAQGKRNGLKYWSTQGSTNGIGYRTEYFGGSKGIDTEQLYIARVEPK